VASSPRDLEIHSSKSPDSLSLRPLKLTNLQYHTPSSIRQQAISIFGLPDFAVATYDGFVELLMRDLEDFKRAQQDPFYVEKVAPDEAKMADPAKTKIIVGWEECYVLDGKVLADGEAGVVRG
jgi:EthD domain